MTRVLQRLKFAITGVAVLAIAGIGSSGSAQSVVSVSADNSGQTHIVKSGPLKATSSYWTAKTTKAATPMRLKVTGAAAANAARVNVAHGSPASYDPKAPAKSPSSAKAGANGAPAAGSSAVPQQFPGNDAYNYPPPATNVGAVDALGVSVTQFPWAPNGALFFHDPVGGGDFRCSGAAINSQNLSVIFTAGHCVANGGQAYFYDNFAFCPAYDATLATPCQLGVWTVRLAVTTSDWFNNGTLAMDLGALTANCSDGSAGDANGNCPNGASPLVAVTGGEGIAFNQDVTQHFWNIGYPAGSPYDGSKMDLSTASSNHLDGNQGSPDTIGIGSNFTGGSSGGQWYIFFSGGGGWANGHNDYIYLSQPLQMFSPYYGDAAASVYNVAATN